MNNKITFLLPTCEPDEMFKHLLPSINILKESKDIINFAICFQPPYTEEQVKKVLDEFDKYGFIYKYFYKDYQVKKPYTPLIKMRNDCALLFPDSLVYGLLDDDMSFVKVKINDQLKLALDTFINNDKIGVIAFKTSRSVNITNNCFATDRGILYRGGISYGFKGLMPENLYQFKNIKNIIPNYNNENLLELFGGYQDKFCANVRLLNGDFASIIYTNSVNHIENRKVRGAEGHGWINAQELEGSIAQFIIKYFNKGFLESHSMQLADKDILRKMQEVYEYNDITYIVNYPWSPDKYTTVYKVLNEDQISGFSD